MSESDEIRADILRAFGLKPRDVGAAPVPLRIRIWRAVTFAYRRGRAVDWRSYNLADADYQARQEAYIAALPRREQAVADMLSDLLPDGMRFEWVTDDE